MSEYGYIPEAPEQSFGNNKGIFTPKDIYDLTRADKYTNYGQLELIETKSISGVSSAVFTDIKQDIYNVHFVSINNMQVATDNTDLRIRFYENGVEETGSVYQIAYQYGSALGSFGEVKSTAYTYLRANFNTGNATNEVSNSYLYFYNLGDSSKYSFMTEQGTTQDQNNTFYFQFGSGVMTQASTVDQIKLYNASGNFSATASLYGIKEYS